MRSSWVPFITLALIAGCRKDPPVAQPAPTPVAAAPVADGPPAEDE